MNKKAKRLIEKIASESNMFTKQQLATELYFVGIREGIDSLAKRLKHRKV